MHEDLLKTFDNWNGQDTLEEDRLPNNDNDRDSWKPDQTIRPPIFQNFKNNFKNNFENNS